MFQGLCLCLLVWLWGSDFSLPAPVFSSEKWDNNLTHLIELVTGKAGKYCPFVFPSLSLGGTLANSKQLPRALTFFVIKQGYKS